MDRHYQAPADITETRQQAAIEGERCIILSPRSKRFSLTRETHLPNIQEAILEAEEHGQSRKGHHHTRVSEDKKQWRKSSFSSFDADEHRNTLASQNVNLRERIFESCYVGETALPEIGRSNGVNTHPFECKKSTRTSKCEKRSLNIECTRGGKMEERSVTSSEHSSKTGKTETHSYKDKPPSVHLPELKCKHQATTASLLNHKDNQYKIPQWQRNLDTDPGKCVICEITEATAKFASVESNRLLLEIVYPHEFYDKFSRAAKKVQNNSSETKDSISICKPVKVLRKPRREKTFSQPQISDRNNPTNTPIESEPVDPPEADQELSPEKKRRRELAETPCKKAVHVQCKARSNAVVITDDTDGQRMVLRGLRGWIMRKEDSCKDRVHKDVKQSLYQVSTLGMQFSLPEYNRSLTNRKPSSPRDMVPLTTPRPIERSYTQMSRGIQLGTTPRETYSFRREGTNHYISKLFSRSMTEGNLNLDTCNKTESVTYSARTSGNHTTIEAASSPVHLPSIKGDTRQTVAPDRH